MKKVIELYENEIESKFDDLSDESILGGNYEEKVKVLNELTGRYVDLQKIQVESTKAENERNKICYEHDEKLVEQQIEKSANKRKTIFDTLGVIVPTAGAIWGVIYTWHKEQDGINASSAGKAMTNSILKFLKR